jgi:photoactive yellow protein
MKIVFEWNEPEALTAEAVATMSPEDWNEVAFGVIELDLAMTVRTYNPAECSLSRRNAASTIGRHFFEEVAPCTDGPGFRGRIETLRHGDDRSFDFEFAFPWGVEQVRVRALRLRESVWLMVKRNQPEASVADMGETTASA